MVGSSPILDTYGANAPFVNGGDVRNRGFEIALNWNDQVGDFTYGANLNISRNKNEVTKIANTEGIIHGDPYVLSNGAPEMYRAQVDIQSVTSTDIRHWAYSRTRRKSMLIKALN